MSFGCVWRYFGCGGMNRDKNVHTYAAHPSNRRALTLSHQNHTAPTTPAS